MNARKMAELALQEVKPQQIGVRGRVFEMRSCFSWRITQTNFQGLDQVAEFAEALGELARELAAE